MKRVLITGANVPEMSKYDFDYNVVTFDESLKGIEPKKTMR